MFGRAVYTPLMSFEDQERPFGIALVAAWFAVGAVALVYLLTNLYRAMQMIESSLGDAVLMIAIGGGILLTIGLLAIAFGIWNGRRWSRTVACSVLLATAAAAVWKGTAMPNLIIAGVNVGAFVYMLRARRFFGSELKIEN